MKKPIIIFFMLLAAASIAQSNSGFGITAGANYGSTGDLRQNGQTIINNPKEELGYHVGVFYKQDFGVVFIRPELKYTKLSNEYNNVQFDVQKLDLPILIGTKIVGPLHLFAGPSLQYIVDTNLDLRDVELSDVENEFTIGAQFGIGVNLGNLGIDVRYERGFTENEVTFIESSIGLSPPRTLDTRPEQIILAISLKL